MHWPLWLTCSCSWQDASLPCIRFIPNRIRISHEKIDDQIVLTASTEELQKFVSKYADDPSAYVEPEVLIRQQF